MNFSWFSTLRARLVLLVLVGAIPALGLILYASWTQRRVATSLVQENALSLARLTAIKQDQLLDTTHHLLLTLAQHPALHQHNVAECNALFARLAREYPVYAALGVIDLDGTIFASEPYSKSRINVGDRDYFKNALKLRDYAIGSYQVGRLTGKATINVGYPLLDKAGQPRAVVYAALDLEGLNKLAASAHIPQGGVLMVVQGDGTILVRHPHPKGWVGLRLPNEPIIKTMLRQREGTSKLTGLDGTLRLWAFAPLTHHQGSLGGYVSVGIPARQAYAAANRALARNLIGLVIATFLALLAAWFGGDIFILRRVQKLVQATRRLGLGDLSARTGLAHGRDELGQIALAVDEMADSLERRVAEREQAKQELHDLNESLEQRVDERTQVLHERTRDLEAEMELARDLQQALIPQSAPAGAPAVPRVVGPRESVLRFYQRYHPSGRIGGDFFDVIDISDTEAGVFICDVMGNGVRAALVTAILRGLLEELKPLASDAGRFLTEVNRGLLAVFRQTGSPIFATAFFLIADVDKGQLRFANAGHPTPLHIHHDPPSAEPLQPASGHNSPALGLVESFSYPTHYASLAAGDLIMMFTDGLFEVDDAEGREYGQERLLETVRRLASRPPIKMFDELLFEIQQYSMTQNFADDVCLIGLEVTKIGQTSLARGEHEPILAHHEQ